MWKTSSEELDMQELIRKGIPTFQAAVIVLNSVLSDSFGSWLLPSSPGQGSGLGETCQRATTGPVCVNTQCPAGTAWGPQQPLSSGTEKNVTFSLHFKPCLLTG